MKNYIDKQIALNEEKQSQNTNTSSKNERIKQLAKINRSRRNLIQKRISAANSRLKLGVNPSMVTSAIDKYIQASQKNPNLKHFDILRKLPAQNRSQLSPVINALPLPIIVNASNVQFNRALRDIKLKEETEILNEQFNPPAMLLLKRQAIRVFPNGQRVVMYSDNKYGLTFPVPYDYDKGFGVVNTSGTMQNQPAAKGYVNEEMIPIIFASGEQIEVEKQTMDKIAKVHSLLNEENKSRLRDMTLQDKEAFEKVKQFAELIK